MVEDAPDGVKQFAHDGDDGHLRLLGAGEKVLVAGFDLRTVLDGNERR